MNRAADSHEIRPLTGVRAVAALWVVFFHFYDEWAKLLPVLGLTQPFASRGTLGVDVFFVLSGFILSYVYPPSDTPFQFGPYRRFLSMRLARLYPVHFCTLGILVLLVGATHLAGIRIEGDYPLKKLPFELTLTTWGFLPFGGWNYPSWSISAEWFAYLFVFPLSSILLKCRWTAARQLVLGYSALCGWIFLGRHGADDYGPLRVSLEFLAGAMAFGAFSRGPALAKFCQRQTTPILAVGLGIALLAPSGASYAKECLTLLIPLGLIGLTSEASLAGRFLGSRVMVWGGRVSYSLYMSHAIAQKVLKVVAPSSKHLADPLIVRIGILLMAITMLIAGAALLHHFVEEPGRNWIRRRLQKRATAPAPAAK